MGKPTNKKYQDRVQRMMQGQFKIDGKAIPVLLPTQAYKHLGVHITLMLDWRAQKVALQMEVRERLKNILASAATPDQKIRIIKQKKKNWSTQPSHTHCPLWPTRLRTLPSWTPSSLPPPSAATTYHVIWPHRPCKAGSTWSRFGN